MSVFDAIVFALNPSAAAVLPGSLPTTVAEPGLLPRYLFYCYTGGEKPDGEHRGEDGSAVGNDLPASYKLTIWRPRTWPALPPGLSGFRLKLRFLFRWVVSQMHLFAGSEYGALLIYDGEQLAHYSGYTPRYWRFPFVADGDFQIGDTWTAPAHRGKGLALFALRTLIGKLGRPGGCLWYVVEKHNEPSIRVAEKAQFRLAAEGTWVTPWGCKLAGAYVIRRNRAESARPRVENGAEKFA